MSSFQSLFSWIKRWKRILKMTPTIYQACFNPCFPGSSAESLRLNVKGGFTYGFNPCFPGSSAESLADLRSKMAKEVFQSLFSWIKRWKLSNQAVLTEILYVSILVFLDQALKAWFASGWVLFRGVSILVFLDQALKGRINILEGAVRSGFQSLFSWIKRWKLIASQSLAWIEGCFNPCFPGSSAERRMAGRGQRKESKFQSLFSWIKRWKSMICSTRPSTSSRFNPCFPGSSAESWKGNHEGKKHRVSILVFLDQALKAYNHGHRE